MLLVLIIVLLYFLERKIKTKISPVLELVIVITDYGLTPHPATGKIVAEGGKSMPR